MREEKPTNHHAGWKISPYTVSAVFLVAYRYCYELIYRNAEIWECHLASFVCVSLWKETGLLERNCREGVF